MNFCTHIYIYIYIHIHTHTHVYIYIYIDMCLVSLPIVFTSGEDRELHPRSPRELSPDGAGSAASGAAGCATALPGHDMQSTLLDLSHFVILPKRS